MVFKVAVAVASLGWASCARQDAAEAVPHVSTGFGQRQLAQMLEDRPDMQEAVPQSHPVRQWLAEGFDGKRAGIRVHWCGNLPGGRRAAEYSPCLPPYPAVICVSPGTEITPIDRWAAAVYAMNVHENERMAVGSEAGRERLDPDGFADNCTRQEFTALKRTQEFFQERPLPRSGHGRDQWYNWVTSGLGTYEDYKSGAKCPRGMDYVSVFEYYRGRCVKSQTQRR